MRVQSNLTKAENIHVTENVLPGVDDAVMLLDGFGVIGDDPPVKRVGLLDMKGHGE
jgi:hypothetical protein